MFVRWWTHEIPSSLTFYKTMNKVLRLLAIAFWCPLHIQTWMSINLHPKLKWDNLYPPLQKNQLLREVNKESTSLVDEDINLVSAWLNVSLDAVTLTNQKHTTFWERIWFTFHNDKKFNRTKDSLNSQWSTIQRETNKLYGCLAQIENQNESGKTEHDKVFRLNI